MQNAAQGTTTSLTTLASTTTPAPLGFPRQEYSPVAIARPSPPPKRPKGRLLIGTTMFALFAIVGYNVWSAYFRYQAYGTVTGKLIEVSLPTDGVVRDLQVREGDTVRQGQLLFTVDNLNLKQAHARIGDELNTAQAELEAAASKIKWQAAFSLEQTGGALNTYHAAWSNLIREEARRDDLQAKLRRAELLWDRPTRLGPIVAQQELITLRIEAKGAADSVIKLEAALGELKRRADLAANLLKQAENLGAGLEGTGYDQLKPYYAKIEALKAERVRLRERMDLGQVVAPVNGYVVKMHRSASEQCKVSEPILSILEAGSLQAVLYLPQEASTSLKPGDNVKLVVNPYPEGLNCNVLRLGHQYEPAPDNIRRYYAEGQKLLPVYLQPGTEAIQWMALRVGGIVKLPVELPSPSLTFLQGTGSK